MSGDMSNIYKQGGGGEIMKWNKIKINARLIKKTRDISGNMSNIYKQKKYWNKKYWRI